MAELRGRLSHASGGARQWEQDLQASEMKQMGEAMEDLRRWRKEKPQAASEIARQRAAEAALSMEGGAAGQDGRRTRSSSCIEQSTRLWRLARRRIRRQSYSCCSGPVANCKQAPIRVTIDIKHYKVFMPTGLSWDGAASNVLGS